MTAHAGRFAAVAVILSALLLAGCISTEGTGSTGGRSKEGPEKSVGPIDTSKAAVALNTSKARQTAKSTTKRTSRSTKFTARQDTVKASLVRKSKPSFRLPKIERPANPAFTVQIGAFLRPNYALKNQKTAKSRFPRHPVFSTYDRQSKFYRVSVGKFMTRHDALELRREILKKYHREYAGCWVNYIPK